MRRALTVGLLVAGSAALLGVGYWLGTGSSPSPDPRPVADVPRCVDMEIEPPTPRELYGGCAEPGDVRIGFAVRDCVTGPDLFASSLGWGYLGEVMKDGPLPEKVQATCEGWIDSLEGRA